MERDDPSRLHTRFYVHARWRSRASRTDVAAGATMVGVRVIGDSSEDEMVACFLLGELTSRRFGVGIRRALATAGECERLLTDADLADPAANRARRDLLATTRGYGRN